MRSVDMDLPLKKAAILTYSIDFLCSCTLIVLTIACTKACRVKNKTNEVQWCRVHYTLKGA